MERNVSCKLLGGRIVLCFYCVHKELLDRLEGYEPTCMNRLSPLYGMYLPEKIAKIVGCIRGKEDDEPYDTVGA